MVFRIIVLTQFQQYFSYIVTVSFFFFGGENQSTRRKLPTWAVKFQEFLKWFNEGTSKLTNNMNTMTIDYLTLNKHWRRKVKFHVKYMSYNYFIFVYTVTCFQEKPRIHKTDGIFGYMYSSDTQILNIKSKISIRRKARATQIMRPDQILQAG